MNEMELLDATSVAELPKDRFDEMERSYNSRSYRCALHMGAMLRRPKTVRFHWQGILRELSRAEVRQFALPIRCNPLVYSPGKSCIPSFAKNQTISLVSITITNA